MFVWLSIKWRWRAASLLVVLYAFCLATPTAVMAFGQSGIPAHCLTDGHQDAGLVHVHQDGSSHHHSGGKDNDGDRASKCCGLFSVSAIAPDIAILPAPHRPDARQPALATDSRTGRRSDRIDRPPRSPQSL